jgi:acyl-CoA thioesterase I
MRVIDKRCHDPGCQSGEFMRIAGILLTGVAMALLSMVFTGCQKEKAPAATATAEPAAFEGTVVAVGDSLTAGYGLPESQAYPAQLAGKLREGGYSWRVVNAGISGETSSGTLSRVNWILKLKPDVVVLETGANDGLRGLDPQLMRRNIDQIVTALQAKGVVVVLAGMKMLKSMGPDYVAQFADVYPGVAKEHNLILIPFILSGVAGDATLNQQDGIHPTAKGYGIVTDTVYPYVVQAIAEKKGSKLR